MILISNNNVTKPIFGRLVRLVCFVALAILSLPQISFAQAVGQTLSVSPTLFQMTATPGQFWQSELRVVNVNAYDITIYPQVVNFAPKGEGGNGDFIPVFSAETNGQTLAEWVDIAKEGIVIAPQETATIPFSVQVPANAAPGGHYAAILIGTKPAEASSTESVVKTAQFVTALYFMRVAGDVVESGSIREFRTTQSVVQKPDVNFEVRFQNTGNVHLQPQGDISIFNMWGEERGTIPINHQTHFGNVLPDSIRKFEFAWKSEESLFDIGRYKAIVTLGYGEDTKNFSTSTTYFWIVPYKQILWLLAGLGMFIWFFTFAVKRYVRRMLLLSGIAPHQLPERMVGTKNHRAAETVRVTRYHEVIAPVRFGIRDFGRLFIAQGTTSRLAAVRAFLWTYRVAFAAALVVGIAAGSIITVWQHMHTVARPYEVTIGNPDAPVTLSSESIYYDNLKSQGTFVPPTVVPEFADFSLTIVNVSGELGKAAKLRVALESSGYNVESVSGDLSRVDKGTKIIFNSEQADAALALSKRLGGVLLSADENAEKKHLTIYVGADLDTH